jgi:hypothetical protein
MPLFNLASSAQWCAIRDMEFHADNIHLEFFGLNLRERSPIVAMGVILRRMSA